jgi:lysophospholipase L1-like esterase
MAQSRDGNATVVEFPAAAAHDGAPPVTVSCAPPSGSVFPVGTTTVTCTATDALQRTATCGFSVILEAPPRLSATKFLAFGDSLTEGKMSFSAPMFLLAQADSYPSKLQALLLARYTAQTIVMTNAGQGGELASEARARFDRELDRTHPETVLLMEGVDDLNGFGSDGVSRALAGLEAMSKDARARGLAVFLATLPPQRPGGQRAGAVALVPILNERLPALAAEKHVVLVDVYSAFGSEVDTLIGPDGLHPTDAGYQRIAETFFAAIKGTLELSPTPTTSNRASAPLGANRPRP